MTLLSKFLLLSQFLLLRKIFVCDYVYRQKDLKIHKNIKAYMNPNIPLHHTQKGMRERINAMKKLLLSLADNGVVQRKDLEAVMQFHGIGSTSLVKRYLNALDFMGYVELDGENIRLRQRLYDEAQQNQDIIASPITEQIDHEDTS
jgi:hypothetical protein